MQIFEFLLNVLGFLLIVGFAAFILQILVDIFIPPIDRLIDRLKKE